MEWSLELEQRFSEDEKDVPYPPFTLGILTGLAPVLYKVLIPFPFILQ